MKAVPAGKTGNVEVFRPEGWRLKPSEWLKWITEQFVLYLDTPRDIRRERRRQRRRMQPPWSVRWFGLVPLGLSMWLRRRPGR